MGFSKSIMATRPPPTPAVLLAAIFLWALPPGLASQDQFQQGIHLLRARHYEESIEAFTRVLEAVPHDHEAYNNRGVAWMKLQAYDRAIADFSEAVALFPGHVNALTNRGAAWYEKGAFDRAIADYSQALELNPHSSRAYNNRGYAWSKLGLIPRALDDYRRALEIDPFFAEVYNNIAWIRATCPEKRFRDGRRAITLAKRALDLEPNYAYMDTLAAAYAESGDFETAVKIEGSIISMLNHEQRLDEIPAYQQRLQRYRKHLPLREAYTRAAAASAAPATPPVAAAAAARPVPGEHPYTIQVASMRRQTGAIRLAAKLKTAGLPATCCPTAIPGRGNWHRVFVGFYSDRMNARKALARLRTRHPEAFVTKLPVALELAAAPNEAKLNSLAIKLEKRGYLTYVLPAAGQPSAKRLLFGAFPTAKRAEPMRRALETEGFRPRPVRR
jgi:tetratricopeptide (TPR) repeat protein